MSRNKRFNCINVEDFESFDQDISEFDRANLFKHDYKKDEFEEYDFNLHFSGLPESRSSINGKQVLFLKFNIFFFQIKSIFLNNSLCIQQRHHFFR